ncbi:multidrug DMT transporter permease [Legionella sp. CNM-4043-24]|uniref:multidrug DMT transporter permease n=1 Tax=Legionella sp. CNM-4043-24 TaxID=3421646 RepID=UPI00403B29ED
MRYLMFFLGLSGFSFQVTAQTLSAECPQQYCVAVVDAGSTGSRLHVYSYDLDANQAPVNITERWSKKSTPGIASLESQKSALDASLDSLFTGLTIHNIPVYFYATAGMRLLPQPRQQKMYALIRDWFDHQSDVQLVQAKTITGSDEGLFGWLAVNYQTGGLTNERALVGVMDFGGASVQISFPVTDSSSLDPDSLRQVHVNGQRLTLFVRSFLGLGQTEVAHQFLNSSPCFSTGYELPDGQLAQGNAYACERNVSTLVKSVHQVDGVVQPGISRTTVSDWYAIGGMVEMAKGPLFSFREQQFTSEQLLNKGDAQVCQQPWSSLIASYPSDDYLYGDCLFSSYYYALMVEGYGLRPDQNIQYLSANQQSDWTLGVVLNTLAPG